VVDHLRDGDYGIMDAVCNDWFVALDDIGAERASDFAALLTIYLSRCVVHVSDFKEWKSEPISQKTCLRQFKQGVRKN
jgi:hypothetical protein